MNYFRSAEILAHLLDKGFTVFGFRFGLDPLMGLLPGFGDLLSLILSSYLVWVGIKMRIPSHELRRMIRNILFDYVVGFIPVLGDAADFIYKCNLTNLEILRKYEKGTIIDAEVLE